MILQHGVRAGVALYEVTLMAIAAFEALAYGIYRFVLWLAPRETPHSDKG